MNKCLSLLALASLFIVSCKQAYESQTEQNSNNQELVTKTKKETPFLWEGANIYFLLTDRFYNGNTKNDTTLNRTNPTGPLRGFMGGDIAGITQKINEGYFTNLGVNAIWFTPVVEQVHGDTDENTGNTYGYHGYWTKDWTALDPNFGTKKELKTMIRSAHDKGIRVLMDVVLNHTGPVTDKDSIWPKDWVRNQPTCKFTTYENTTSCTLVDNLPDILTKSDTAVKLPKFLLKKWKSEGRLNTEIKELERFFERTGYARVPRAYIIKWLTDYVKEFGIDGYRVDTVKHVEEQVWAELYKEASYAFDLWKKMNKNEVLDDTPFYMMGEVYNYGISGGKSYDFGDKKVNYFDYGFNSLINFELKSDAAKDYERIFKKYDSLLHKDLKDYSVVNYLTSHDDAQPFDKDRKSPYKSANILLLTPGISQIYYGDETARNLNIPGAIGDATLRSFMNWEEIDNSRKTKSILAHWQKLGQFRKNHLAIGAGKHKRIGKNPYVFSRTYTKDNIKDKVVIGLDLPKGKKTIWVKDIFKDGIKLFDSYSETTVTVANGKVLLNNEFDVALLEMVP